MKKNKTKQNKKQTRCSALSGVLVRSYIAAMFSQHPVGSVSFDHRFLIKIYACTRKTSLTTVNRNDKPKSWGCGDFTG